MSITLSPTHPLFGAPADVVLIYVIAQEVGIAAADQALAIRIKAMAANGDKQAQKLMTVAGYLGIPAQCMVKDLGIALPETFAQATARLIGFAAERAQINAKMINDLFGVGLINKALRDEIFDDFQLAA